MSFTPNASSQDRQTLANAIRFLSMDAVQKANSGHPGAPMGMADIAEVLWNDYLQHNPNNPNWANRDRFVLSNGHGSMLIYSLLHLSGYDVAIDDIKQFRQLHSKTPGHPEYGYTPGVETTTGPLGQGMANAVGMALAEKMLAAQFNHDNHHIIDHHTYVFAGDGCLMEGISHEVASLAGTQGLGKLIVFYDDNNISIDGEVAGWFTDNSPQRFNSYNWQVIENIDGHDSTAIINAIEAARCNIEQPTLICCKTAIGKGAPNKEGKSAAHGAPLGDDEIALTRRRLSWDLPAFEISDDIYNGWNASEKGNATESNWNVQFAKYQQQYPELAAELQRRLNGKLPVNFVEQSNQYIAQCQKDGAKEASRKSSQNCLNAYGLLLPELVGGSADLAGSNLTIWSGSRAVTASDASGNYIYYGVREFGMTAIMNGIALHGGFINYAATFLIFMEYARNALRMSALMKQKCIHVYTHDSIGLGEDGPTHQPIEQLGNLRMTPGLHIWRPCDSVESAVAWQQAILENGPSALVFSRQGLTCQARNGEQLNQIHLGAYILSNCDATPDLILIATGSEVQIALDAQQQLSNMNVRVVSMPCTERFDAQDNDYKRQVLPNEITKRIAIEAAHIDSWHKYVGLNGKIIGMTSFGESAPAADLYQYFGITVEAVIEAANSL